MEHLVNTVSSASLDATSGMHPVIITVFLQFQLPVFRHSDF